MMESPIPTTLSEGTSPQFPHNGPLGPRKRGVRDLTHSACGKTKANDDQKAKFAIDRHDTRLLVFTSFGVDHGFAQP
jgi:hypothetical protein